MLDGWMDDGVERREGFRSAFTAGRVLRLAAAATKFLAQRHAAARAIGFQTYVRGGGLCEVNLLEEG